MAGTDPYAFKRSGSKKQTIPHSALPHQEHSERQTRTARDELQTGTNGAESFRRKDKRQADQTAHQQHPANRANTKNCNINQTGDSGRKGGQDQNHQRGTTRHPMNHANDEWPGAELDQMSMPMSVLVPRPVHVHVNVFSAVVTVLVNVDTKATNRLQ